MKGTDLENKSPDGSTSGTQSWNFKELLRNKLRFTWSWAEVLSKKFKKRNLRFEAWKPVFVKSDLGVYMIDLQGEICKLVLKLGLNGATQQVSRKYICDSSKLWKYHFKKVIIRKLIWSAKISILNIFAKKFEMSHFRCAGEQKFALKRGWIVKIAQTN